MTARPEIKIVDPGPTDVVGNFPLNATEAKKKEWLEAQEKRAKENKKLGIEVNPHGNERKYQD